jgi:hypothetical protein
VIRGNIDSLMLYAGFLAVLQPAAAVRPLALAVSVFAVASGEWPRTRSGMSVLHEARGPLREPQIDTVGWLFLAFAVAITATAAMVAYSGSTTVANAPVLQVAAH